MPLKRKLSDRLGPPWTKEDIAEFLQGFRAHGQDWKKVASLVRNRTVEMVAALYTMNRAYLSLPEVSVDALFAMMTDHCNFMQEGCLSNGDVSSGDEIESRSSSQKKKKIGNGGNAGAPAGVLVPGKKGGSTPSKRGALSESFKLKEKDKGLKVVMQKEKEKEKEEKKDEKEEKKDEKKDEKKEKEKEVVKEIKPGATPSLGLPMGLTGTPGRRPTGRRTPRGPFSGMTAEKEREREERGKEEREKEEKEKEEEEEEEKDVEKENKRERLGKREKLKDKEGEKERVRLKEFERDQKVSDRENRREERESQRLKEKESLKQKERENQRLKEKDSQRVKDREREKEEREKESVKESVKEKVKEREKERERERDKEKKEESSRDKERDAERKKFEKEKKSNKVRDKDREVAGNPTASPENRRGSRGDGGQGNKDKASRDKEKVKEKEKPKAKDKVKPKDKLPESSKSEKETVREPVSPSHSTRKLQRTRQGEVKARPIVENAGAVPVRKTDGEAMTSSNGTVKGGAAEVGIGAKRTSDRSESTPKRENARSTPRKLVSKSLKDGATAGKGSEVSERRRGALFESNEVSPEQVVARERSGGTTSTAAVVAGCGASTRKQTHSPGEEDVDMEPDSSSREGGVGNENTKKKSLRRTKSVNVSLDISRGGEGSVGPAAIASPQGRKGGGTGEREEKMARKLVDDAGPEGNAKRARRQDKEKVRDRAVERVKKEQALIQEEKEEGEVDEEADEESKREGDDHVDTREEVEEPRRKRKTPMAPQQDSKKFRGMYSDNGSGLDALATLAVVSLNGLLRSQSEEAPRARVSGAGAGEEEDSESRFPLAEHVRDSVSNPSSRTISPVSTPETGHPTGTSGAWSAMSPPSNSQQMSSPSAQVPKDREWAGAGPQTRGRAPQTPGQSGLHLGSSASVSLVQSVSPAGDARSSPTNMSSGAARDGLRSGAIAACSGVAMTASAAANDATAENVSPSGSGAVDARGGCGSVPKEVTKEDGTVKRAVPDDATRREGGGAKAPLEPPPSQPPAQHEGRKRKRKPVPEKLPLITPPPGNKPPDPMIKPRNKPKRITPGRDATPKDGGSKHGLAGQRILRDDGALSLAREGEEVGAVSSGGSELVGTCATPAATGEKSALPLKLRSKKQRMGVATAGSASMSGGPAENGSACDGVENRLPSGAVQGSSGEEIVTHPKGGAEHTRGGTGGSVTTGSEHPTSPKPREPATCAHVTTGLKGASGKARLMHALLSPSVQRWCMCEWFYSDIDLPWFIRNEFVEYLQHLGLGHVTRLTRVEWGEIRSSLGKPRRLSQAFLREERGKLALHRELARNHYQEMRSGVVEGFSQDFAKPLAVGQRVTARHPKKGQIHDGSVLTVDRGRCRVQFDRTDLGVELVEDTDVMPVNPMENLPDTMKRRRMPDGFDDSRNRAGLPLLNGVPATGTFVASGTIGNHFIDQPNGLTPTGIGSQASARRTPGQYGPGDSGEGTPSLRVVPNDAGVPTSVHGTPLRTLPVPQGTAREADVRALGELARVLDKKDLLLAELRRMNDEVEGGAIAVDGLVGEASSKADAFQRQYATVVLQLKEVNKQVERALLRLRQRNKYHESTLPPWQKGSPQMYSGAGMVYGGIPSSPSNVNDGSHLTASGSGGFGIGMYGGLSSGLPLASARGNGSVFTSGVGVATSGSSAAATGNGSAVMSPVIEAPFPIGEMAASARRQARAMVASVVQAFASEKMEAEDQAGRPTSRESSGEGAMEANGATTSEGGGGAAAGGGVGATATTTGGESGKDSGTADSCPTSKVSSLSRSGRPPLVPPDPLVGINPLIMPGTAKEAALLTELMASCVATLLMVQNCTERSLPHSDVVLTLDSALSSLRPHDSSNSSVFKEIERSIATIKSQIVAEVPATHVP